MECEELTGSGCAGLVTPPTGECPDSGVATDTASEAQIELHGSGWGASASTTCATAPGPSWLVVALFAALWARRGAAALGVVLLLLPRPARADDIDAEAFSPADGGPALTLLDADLGSPWSPAVAQSWTVSLAPAVARTPEGDEPLLDGVATGTLGGSIRIAQGPRVGASLRLHQWLADNTVDSAAGDAMLWVSVPLVAAEERRIYSAFSVDAVLPTGPRGVFLSDESGAVDGRLTLRAAVGSFDTEAEVGVHLQRTQVIENLTWGARYRWAAAVSARPWSLGLVAVEAFGSGPLEGDTGLAALTPVEFVASAGACLRWGLCLRAGGGAGLTYGFSAPAGRLLAVVEWRPPPRTDRDEDGILDLRDDCPDVPEDVDLLQDDDGCPEDDVDGDGVPDPRDVCPTAAETVNLWQDEDGCPDVVAAVTLLVRGDASVPTEAAAVTGLGAEPITVFVGEPKIVRVPFGGHAVGVEAEGYLPWRGTVDAFAPEVAAVVELVPVRYGDVALTLVDAGGASLAGVVRRGDDAARPDPVPAEGARFHLTTGSAEWIVTAPGHAARRVPVDVRAGELTELRVVLAPVDLRLDGDRITTRRVITFDLDQAAPRADSLPVVDDLAALLAARPDIVLLRIEGHADESGTSRHNLDLSRARALAVRDALVARGVDPARLEALGSGEARRQADTRTVDFLVLVWGDDAAPPPNPPGR